MINTFLDICEVATSCAYAVWLRKHKGLEPKATFLEVVAGVGYTLAFSTLRGAAYGGDWWQQSKRFGRDLFLAGTPIIVGEIDQWIESRAVSTAFDEEYRT